MDNRVRVHWDRVGVLLAVVALLLFGIGHVIVRAVTNVRADRPTAEVAPAAAADAVPEAAPDAKPCPPAPADVLRSAPHRDGQRTVAITFDDGPGPWTDDVLAILAQQDVKATFFVVGKEAAAKPELVQEIIAAGHAVENHSWSHPSAGRGQRWDPELIGREIRRTNAEIERITGQPPCFFRPPQGVVPGSERKAETAGLSIALWSVDTRDWAVRGSKAAKVIRSRAGAGLTEPNPVVLLHDGGGDRHATVAALPGIIQDYRTHGYAFVTLDDGRL